jgi:thioredoxin-like negative regulator of GroEL
VEYQAGPPSQPLNKGNIVSKRVVQLAAVLIFAALFTTLRPAATAASADSPAPQYVGNRACAACHLSIYQSYSRTPMAETSGPVGANLVAGSFEHAPSAMRYRVYQKDGRTFLDYQRTDNAHIHGTQELSFVVGSGRRGRSYLFGINGFLYQSPVSYYSQKKRWDMSPGYESSREMPFNRPIEPSCLTCHASQVRPVSGTDNRYDAAPFAQDGIGCERCHGPGSEHIKSGAAMINPAKLDPARRDSICAQCHMSGEARINQPGRSSAMFRPGDLLTDTVLDYVYEGDFNYPYKAISHVQALAESRCKLASGDRMSCLSCHDPHTLPPAEERAAYFRQKCLACHLQSNVSAEMKRHFESKPDCRSCHMPAMQGLSIGHTTLTDHRILRKPLSGQPATKPATTRLVQFGARQADARGLGLAYAELAARDNQPFYAAEAMRLLTEALPTCATDAEVLTRLGYLHQTKGEIEQAASLYERALRSDPHKTAAAVNLGVLYAQHGRVDRAIELWRDALASNPGLSEASIDLAIALLAEGDKKDARDVLVKALRFDPDSAIELKMLHDLGDQ